MPETYDITLGGVGYPVAPKTYKRGLDAPGNIGTAPVRQVQREWAGALRPVQLERDRHWSSVAVLPLDGGGGAACTAGPKETTAAISGFPAIKPRFSVLVAGRPYLATGGILYRPERAGAGTYPNNFAGVSQLGTTLAQQINGLCTDGRDFIYAGRAGAGYVRWPIGGGAWDTTPVMQLVGCAWYAGQLFGGVNDPSGYLLAHVASGSTLGTTFPLDSAPLALLVARDALYVTTATALYRLTGKMVSGVFQGQLDRLAGFAGMGYADDGASLAEYNGEIYVWMGGEVCRYYAGGATPARWQRTGLRGIECRGLAAAGGRLWAAVVTSQDPADTGLWGWDGTGWWCVARNPDGLHDYSGPQAAGGYFTNCDLLAWGWGIGRSYAFQLRPTVGQPGRAPSGELVTSLWYGRDPDALKAWTRAGVELSAGGTPNNPATVALDASTDGGATWAQLATATPATYGPTTITGTLPAATRTRAIALRVRYSGLTDLADAAPTIGAVWAEYRGIEAAQHRRLWDLEIVAADDGIRRNGSADTRRGGTISAALWAAFDARATLAYRDIDYDRDPTERQVRIASLTESVPRPGDAGRWTDTTLRVRLVEV